MEIFKMLAFSHGVTMTIESGNISLFFQFFLTIRNEIVRGDRQPGERLPTVEQLSKQYGISIPSILKALTLLEQAGLVTKKQGVGIHVCDNPVHPVSKLSSSLSEELKKIKSLKHKIISAEWIDPPKRISYVFRQNLNALKKGKIFRIRRVWKSKKESWRRRLSDVYVPAFLHSDIFKNSETDVIVLKKIFETDEYASEAIKSIETIYPWNCDVEMARYLEIPDGIPIFQTTNRYYAESGKLLWIGEAYTTASAVVRELQIEGP
jgi:GntR family transcriptional regulator